MCHSGPSAAVVAGTARVRNPLNVIRPCNGVRLAAKTLRDLRFDSGTGRYDVKARRLYGWQKKPLSSPLVAPSSTVAPILKGDCAPDLARCAKLGAPLISKVRVPTRESSRDRLSRRWQIDDSALPKTS